MPWLTLLAAAALAAPSPGAAAGADTTADRWVATFVTHGRRRTCSRCPSSSRPIWT